MRIALVVAVAANGVIGRDGTLPWHLPGDLKRFKELTLGKPILMGRKTWDSLPRRPLPGRDNLVVSRQAPSGERDGAHWFGGLEAAVQWAQARSVAELCVIGGAGLFAETLPIADRLHLTRIEQPVEGDTVMPDIGGGWRELWSSAPVSENGLSYRCIDLERAET